MAITRYIVPAIIAAALFISPVRADSNCCSPCTEPQEYYSKTFFSGIKIWEVGKPAKEIFFLNHRLTEREDNCWGGALQIAGYGGKSVNSNDMAQYFLPYGKCCLYVTEYKLNDDQEPVAGSTVNGGPQQLEARNFNIGTAGISGTYTGTICISPQQSVAGIGFTWKQTLWQDADLDPMLWMEVSFPVEFRSNKMNLYENTASLLVSDGETGLSGATHVATMTEAFQQSAMLYGRIDDNCNMSKWGVADIEIRFGYNSIKGECCDMNGYLGFVAPTGTKINAKTMQNFFPVVIGNNNHWGLMFGSHLGYDMYEHGHHMLRYELDMCSKWLFANHQVRSFDLVQQGNWSRFLELYSGLDQATEASVAGSPAAMNIGTFGINLLTQKVKVEPRFNTNVNTAILYNYKNWEFDLGYNLYVRQAERIEMNCFPTGIGVKDINGDGQTNLARTIKNNFTAEAIVVADYSLHTLQICDIDLNSAAAPAVLSNTVYAGADYNFNCGCIPGFVGIAALYEFSLANASVDRWILVGKFGFSY